MLFSSDFHLNICAPVLHRWTRHILNSCRSMCWVRVLSLPLGEEGWVKEFSLGGEGWVEEFSLGGEGWVEEFSLGGEGWVEEFSLGGERWVEWASGTRFTVKYPRCGCFFPDFSLLDQVFFSQLCVIHCIVWKRGAGYQYSALLQGDDSIDHLLDRNTSQSRTTFGTFSLRMLLSSSMTCFTLTSWLECWCQRRWCSSSLLQNK